MFYFYTPWKCQKTLDFQTFPGGIEIEHWAKMGANAEGYKEPCQLCMMEVSWENTQLVISP